MKTAQKTSRDKHEKYAHPLPLEVFPLPAFLPSNPLSYLRIAFWFLRPYLALKSSHGEIHRGYYSPLTRSIHVTDGASVRALWEKGFFGKGSLSRSEPEWLTKERERLGFSNRSNKTAGQITEERRKERIRAKRERAKAERELLEEQLRKERLEVDASNVHTGQALSVSNESNAESRIAGDGEDEGPLHVSTKKVDRTGPKSIMASGNESETSPLINQEHLQLSPEEALFLSYEIGTLQVHRSSSESSAILQNQDLFELFQRTSTFPPLASSDEVLPDDSFILNYVVYQHFRSLGWVVRPGIKFAVDWLLYARGPVFSHAEFAVVILPSYARWTDEDTERSGQSHNPPESVRWRERGEWWWFHSIVRVQAQVKKTLVLCYVEIPTVDEVRKIVTGNERSLGQLMKRYKIREFVIRRWTPNRNRD